MRNKNRMKFMDAFDVECALTAFVGTVLIFAMGIMFWILTP